MLDCYSDRGGKQGGAHLRRAVALAPLRRLVISGDWHLRKEAADSSISRDTCCHSTLIHRKSKYRRSSRQAQRLCTLQKSAMSHNHIAATWRAHL